MPKTGPNYMAWPLYLRTNCMTNVISNRIFFVTTPDNLLVNFLSCYRCSLLAFALKLFLLLWQKLEKIYILQMWNFLAIWCGILFAIGILVQYLSLRFDRNTVQWLVSYILIHIKLPVTRIAQFQCNWIAVFSSTKDLIELT